TRSRQSAVRKPSAMSNINVMLLSLSLALLMLNPGRGDASKPTRWHDNDRIAQVLTDAAMRGQYAVVRQYLESGVSIDAAPREGWTALMAASTFGHPDIVQLLLSKGANPNMKLPDGATVLYQAAQNGNREAVHALIAAGAQLDVSTRDGRTP